MPNNSSCAVVKVFFIATGVKKHELLNYLSDLASNDIDKINDNATLSCYATTDANGTKYFFYENWFYNYDFERSILYKVDNWPDFTRHWIDISVRWDNGALK